MLKGPGENTFNLTLHACLCDLCNIQCIFHLVTVSIFVPSS